MPKSRPQDRFGFTLIELSIGLVIIGLVVGGVLVARELIKTAELRATLSMLEQLNIGTSAFKFKYNGLPGDLPRAKAMGYGLYGATSGVTAMGMGDGDGVIKSPFGNHASGFTYGHFYGEAPIYFRHLTEAGMVSGNYGMNMGTLCLPLADLTSNAEASFYMPTTRDNDAVFSIMSDSGTNFFIMTSVVLISSANGSFAFPGVDPLTPFEAYQIDSKIDNSLPTSGGVLGFSSVSGDVSQSITWRSGATAGSCHASGAYVMTTTTDQCSLAIRLQ